MYAIVGWTEIIHPEGWNVGRHLWSWAKSWTTYMGSSQFVILNPCIAKLWFFMAWYFMVSSPGFCRTSTSWFIGCRFFHRLPTKNGELFPHSSSWNNGAMEMPRGQQLPLAGSWLGLQGSSPGPIFPGQSVGGSPGASVASTGSRWRSICFPFSPWFEDFC